MCQSCGHPSLPTVLPNHLSLCSWVPRVFASYLTYPPYEGITGDSAVSSEGVWVLCSQPQGAEESQLFLCGHVWPQQLSHQPPGPHLGGKCPGSAKARPLASWGMLGWLSLPSHGPSPVLPSQRLPHKVRKLYSALERLLVSAGPIPTFSGPWLLAFRGFQCPSRTWIPLVCGYGNWLREFKVVVGGLWYTLPSAIHGEDICPGYETTAPRDVLGMRFRRRQKIPGFDCSDQGLS